MTTVDTTTELVPVVFAPPCFKVAGPECPECGGVPEGTVDHITGVAQFGEELTYCGDTEVDWDSQETWCNANGDPLVECACGHQWFVANYEMDGEGIAPLQGKGKR